MTALPPPLPGEAAIDEDGWMSLEAAGRCKLSWLDRMRVDAAIATYRNATSCHMPSAQFGMRSSSRQAKRQAEKIKRLAMSLNGEAAAKALELVKEIEGHNSRTRGRPSGWALYPGLDSLLLSLTAAYQGLQHTGRSADWLAFLRFACLELAGAPKSSPEAFKKRAEKVCRGQTPGAPAKRQREAKARRAARLPYTPLGKYIESSRHYIAHASGRFLEAAEITQKNK